MLKPRIIPVLLVRDKGLVKTLKFKSPKYVGDPINAVKIFNEKEVDELTVLDIDASIEGREPDYKMIANLASECRMPLCYGGGIKTLEQAQKILSLGVEKVAFSSAFFDDPPLITRLAEQLGKQSVVLVLDIKKKFLSSKYECYTANGSINTKICPIEFSSHAESLGVGEVVINSIDNDGVMKGYDLEIIAKIKQAVSVPVTALGGAGSIEHFEALIQQEGIIGIAAGSFFVFKGKYRAVLISYPNAEVKQRLFSSLKSS
jgi:cyclase